MKLSVIARRVYDEMVSDHSDPYVCNVLARKEREYLGKMFLPQDECQSVQRYSQIFRDPEATDRAWFDQMTNCLPTGVLRTWRLGMLNYFIQVLEEEESRGNGVAP